DRPALERRKRERAGTVERKLVRLEHHERRVDHQRAVGDGGSRERQEPMHLVAAANVEADDAKRLAVEQEVDGTTELDAVQAHGHRQHLVRSQLLHVDAMVPGPGGQKPSSPTSGTKRQATDLRTAGPSGLRTITSSRWIPNCPTGTTRRPRGSSCS